MRPGKTNTSSRKRKLRKAGEFKAVYERGVKRTSRSFVVFMLANGLAFSRFGITTPRKVGKSHERNRIKRRIREILRGARPQIHCGFDIVVNPRRSVLEREFDALQGELLSLLEATP